MTRRALACLLLLGAALPALAQPAPFDMSPESGLRTPAPAVEPAVPAEGAGEAVPGPASAPAFTRYLLPAPAIRLEGEESRQAVAVYLTQAQAEAPARLEFAYLNALVVAPEVSNLRVRVNQAEISSAPLASSEAPAVLSVEIPAGLLRAGANVIEFRATQRHRTDCSVESTYELWTRLDSGGVRLVFEGGGLDGIAQLADLAAVGVDAAGKTTIRLLSGDLADPEAAGAALKLAQQLAIALRVPELRIEHVMALTAGHEPGVLDVVVMPASQLPDALAPARGQAASGPLAAMLPLQGGAATLVVSGPDWAAIGRATDALAGALPASASRPRIDLADPNPLLLGGQSAALSALGVDTVEFNGRRYATRFQFELPPDFYAYRYGELELVLDAAYSSDVLPGSEIDIYTNGQIASATPLLRTDGGLLRDTVIRIPMTNLRPGRNEVVIGVHLQTASDQVCSAGWTGRAPTRFVLSNSSRLRLPDYARAAAVPDLQVLVGSGWPYSEQASVPLVLGGGDDSLLSAMMIAARIAASAENVLPLAVTPEADLSPAGHALIVAPLPELSPPTLGRIGVSAGGALPGGNGEVLLDQFGGGAPSGFLAGPAEWLLRRVGLQFSDLRVLPGVDLPYAPEPGGVVMSQVRQAEGGIWTILTAPDGGAMRAGAERLIVTENWRQVAGRISALGPADEAVTVIATNNPVLVQTEPFSPANLRLIAANWFSGNILYFTGAVVIAALLLMLATSFVLTQVGRRQ